VRGEPGRHALARSQPSNLFSPSAVFRAKLAVFRCNAAAEIAFTPALSIDQRKMLAGKSENRCQAAWQAFGASFPSEPVMGLDGLDGAEWLEEKCQVPAEQIMADWGACSSLFDLLTQLGKLTGPCPPLIAAELTYMLRSGAFFQAVTAAEKQAVVQALQLGRGSWHQVSPVSACVDAKPFPSLTQTINSARLDTPLPSEVRSVRFVSAVVF
jgi:hypothetical protein